MRCFWSLHPSRIRFGFDPLSVLLIMLMLMLIVAVDAFVGVVGPRATVCFFDRMAFDL